MILTPQRFLLAGITVLVLLSQNLSLGYCTLANEFFISDCPECCDDCCPCGDDNTCSSFLNLELEDFVITDSVSIPDGDEIPLAEITPVSFDTFPENSGFAKTLLIRPPPQGVSLLIQYSVALI